MKLNYLQALERIPSAQGIWVCHGDEPLLHDKIIQTFKACWQQRSIERQRIDIQSMSDWHQVIGALDHLSLFANQLALEVHTQLKPDAKILSALLRLFIVSQDNFLLILMPKQDTQALKHAFFQSMTANATVVTLTATQLNEHKAILMQESQSLSLQLTSDAWQWLLYHHENNLLAARNSLLIVADSYPETQLIETWHFAEIAHDESRYSSFALSEACLKGNLPQAIKILQFLLNAGEPLTSIFWVLQKDMRLILQLFEQPQHAEQFGIWRTKLPLYQAALRRVSAQQLLGWSSLLLEVDGAIKGIGHRPAEDLLLSLVCAFCATPI